MIASKEKLLYENYQKLLDLAFNNKLEIDNIDDLVVEDVMGYGTTVDEKIFAKSGVRELIRRQREQSENIEMLLNYTPVYRRISADENTAVIADDIVMSINLNNETVEMYVRFSSVFVYEYNKWLLVHFHGSKPENVESEKDTFGIDEWKQQNKKLQKLINEKTAELVNKNRELEIEAALERVRAVAMSMHKPDDNLGICKALYFELKSLGFTELRNALIHSFVDEEKYFIDYDYSEATGGNISRIPYTGNLVIEKFIKHIRKSEDGFFDHALEKKELKEWIAFRKNNNEADDPRLENIQSLHYYNYSIGSIGIGISTYKPITKEQRELLERFKNVFQLAYQRYSDISLAEAQAREADIELALERVRARTMAMQKSEELHETSQILFQQMKALGEPVEQLTIGIVKETENMVEIFATIEGSQLQQTFRHSIDEPTVMNKIYRGWKAQQKSLLIELNSDEIQIYNRYRNELVKSKMFSTKISKDDRRIIYAAYFSKGMLALGSNAPLSEESHRVLERFAGVFDGIYTRFLDLQKAEAQVREAQIEVALERIRTQSMIMQHSKELDDTLRVFHEQVLFLGINSAFSYLWLPDEEENRHIFWAAWAVNAAEIEPFNLPSKVFKSKAIDYPLDRSEPATAQCLIDWKGDQPVHTYHILSEGVENYFAAWKELLDGVEELKPKHFKGGLFYVEAFIKYGCFGVLSENDLTDDEKKILFRFAIEFERTYTRFLDLQKAEAQAREANIEAAVERVRAGAMAMHSTSDFEIVVKQLLQQIQLLNLEGFTGAQIMLIDEKEFITVYDCSSPGNIGDPKSETIRYEAKRFPIMGVEILNKWKEGKPYFVMDFDLKKLRAAVKEWEEINVDIAGIINDAISGGHLTHQWDACGRLHNGMIAFDMIKPPDDDVRNITIKMTHAFEQAYTRFLDLQKAEAQAREAEVDLALERVRSQAMAMQKSSDLLDIVVSMRNEFTRLGYEAHYFWHMMWLPEKYEKAMTSGDGTKIGFVMELPRHIHGNIPLLAKWEKSKKPTVVYAMNVEEALDYVDKMVSLGDFKNIDPQAPTHDDIRHIGGLTFVMARTTHGEIGFSLPGVVENPPKEDVDILVRFAGAFDIAHRRFLDLQKAEAQTREAQIELALERVRARTMAMQHSDELSEASFLLDSQVRALGIETRGCAFNIYGENNSTEWFSSEAGTMPVYTTPRENLFLRYYEAGQKGESILIEEFSGIACVAHYEYLCTLPVMGDALKQMIAEGGSFPEKQIDHVTYFKYGYLLFITLEPVPEAHDIFIRFAKVFEQTYTRFLDLQKAEAQTREAQINLAVERVRARALAMFKSEEIIEVVAKLKDEIMGLNIPDVISASIFLKEGNDQIRMWDLTSMEKIDGVYHQHLDITFKLKLDDPHLYVKRVWENSADYFVDTQDRKGFKRLIAWLHEHHKNDIANECENFVESSQLKLLYHATKKLNSGKLSVDLLNPPPEEMESILTKMGAAFDLAYKRFEDLKNSEAQLREAQIEAGLERVRSRTLAMQTSNELAETAAVLFKQLIALGIAPNRLYIGIVKDDSGLIEFWVTDEDGSKVSTQFTGNISRSVSIQRMHEGWKQQNKSLTLDLQGKELQDYFHYLSEELHVPFQGGLSQKRRVQTIAYFSKGFIGMASPDEQPEETTKLLERFASVFNLTFTRFNDLKIAEAHALQAEEDLIKLQTEKKRAEDALTELKSTQSQLIQSEKMASLGELTAGIAHEIQNPLNFVNNFSEVSNELIDEMNTELDKGDIIEAKAIAADVKNNLEKINHHGKRADAIVKGMLQHSRSSTNHKESSDINAIADEYLRLSYHGLRAKDKSFNATMQTNFDTSIGKVNIIPQDVGRVILNLLTNAFYAVNEKKQQQPNGYEPTVSIETKKINNKVEIKVSDNGNGIPQKVLDKIFQPFFTTKPTGQGTGLGLSLSYDIIKAHGGELKVETMEKEGSVFIITLPN